MIKTIFRSPRPLIFTCFISLFTCFIAQAQTPATAMDPVAKSRSADPSTSNASSSKQESARAQQPATSEKSAAPAEARDSRDSREAADPSMPKTDAPGAESSARQGSSTDKWEFQFVPYLWFASLKGQVGIGDRVADVDADFGDIFDRLNFGFMAAFEARKNKLGLFTDLLYLKVSAENATPGTLFSSVKLTQKVFMLEEAVAYRLLEKNGSSVDAMAGIRFWHLNTRLLFTPGISPEVEADRSKNWVDGLGGLRGRAYVSKSIFVFGRGDVGGGGSDLTYQLLGGAGLTWRERFSFLLAYRYLHVNYDRDNFLFDVGIKGPAIGFGIKF
jgi:hypothetical protein